MSLAISAVLRLSLTTYRSLSHSGLSCLTRVGACHCGARLRNPGVHQAVRLCREAMFARV